MKTFAGAILLALLVLMCLPLSVSAEDIQNGELFCSPLSADKCEFLTEYTWETLKSMALNEQQGESAWSRSHYFTRGEKVYKLADTYVERDNTEVSPLLPRTIWLKTGYGTCVTDAGICLNGNILSYYPTNRIGHPDDRVLMPQYELEEHIDVSDAPQWPGVHYTLDDPHSSFVGIAEDTYVFYRWEVHQAAGGWIRIDIDSYVVYVLTPVAEKPVNEKVTWDDKYGLRFIPGEELRIDQVIRQNYPLTGSSLKVNVPYGVFTEEFVGISFSMMSRYGDESGYPQLTLSRWDMRVEEGHCSSCNQEEWLYEGNSLFVASETAYFYDYFSFAVTLFPNPPAMKLTDKEYEVLNARINIGEVDYFEATVVGFYDSFDANGPVQRYIKVATESSVKYTTLSAMYAPPLGTWIQVYYYTRSGVAPHDSDAKYVGLMDLNTGEFWYFNTYAEFEEYWDVPTRHLQMNSYK